MDRDAWSSSHQWASARGRQIDLNPDKPVTHRHCSRCQRDFVEEPSPGERYAVYVSAFSFHRLPESITQKWLGELCPGEPMPLDGEVCRKLIAGEKEAADLAKGARSV